MADKTLRDILQPKIPSRGPGRITLPPYASRPATGRTGGNRIHPPSMVDDFRSAKRAIGRAIRRRSRRN